jgi:hypothetical protein
VPNNPKLAAAEHAPPRPKDEPCTVCGRPWNVGTHYVRAPKGLKCTAPGCKAPLFERCFDGAGAVYATRCLGGNHKVLAVA